MPKRVILIDFDATLNSYVSGFEPLRPEHLPDPPIPGAIGFVRRLCASSLYKPVIFTTRVYDETLDRDSTKVIYAIRDWLAHYGLEPVVAQQMEVTSRKIMNSLIIDDKAFRFEGRYPTPSEIDEMTKKQHKGERK